MSKRVRRNNYLYYNPYLYKGGGFFGELKKGVGSLNLSGLGESLGGSIGAIGSTAGGAVGGLLSNGLESKAGSVFNTVGDIGSAIPGPWGAIIGGGTKIVGGLVNAAFGTKVDQEKLNAANQGTNYLNNFVSNASSFDEVQGPQAQSAVENAYKGGWFSKGKARRKNAELRRQRQEAQLFANRNVENNIENIADEQMNNMLTNYAAFGGPLDIGLFPVGGAIDYELAQRRLGQRDLEIQGKSKFAVGGPLHTHGADWTNGITIIDNGGTHEQNPFEGVPMGVAPDGQPNLVEEGEVIFNNYVFSNRLRVPKAVREKYKLRGQKEMTFADAAKKAQKESEERPNDPISQRGLEDIMYRLMTEQEAIRESRQQRKYSEGGRIHIAPSKKGTFTAAASKHGMGVQEFASKVLANPEDYSPAMRKKANFARNASKWKHAYGGHLFWNGGFGGDNPFNLPKLTAPTITPYINWSDSVSRGKAMVEVNPLQTELPYTTLGQPRFTMGQGLLQTPKLQKPVASTKDPEAGTTYKEPKTSPLANLRYLPAVGSAINVFTDLMGWTNKPDYSNADMIVDAANQFGSVSFSPIGDYMTYTPLDRLFYANQLGAQAGATRRAILNTSGGNRGTAMAGLLAADHSAQGQLGNLFRQAEEYNLAQREKVAAFNRGTNMFNSEQGLKAAIANRERDKARIDALVKAAAIRDAVDSRVGAARSANLTNFFNSLGDIGREAYTMDMIKNNPSLLYDWMGRYKGKLPDKATGEPTSKAKGGYLTIKRRR